MRVYERSLEDDLTARASSSTRTGVGADSRAAVRILGVRESNPCRHSKERVVDKDKNERSVRDAIIKKIRETERRGGMQAKPQQGGGGGYVRVRVCGARMAGG